MGLGKKYKKSLAQQWCLRFKTKHPDGDNYDGVVTHIKKDFIVIREMDDFEFNGTVVLAKKFIKSFRDNKYEQCSNEILRENGEIKQCQPIDWLASCKTLRAVLAECIKQDIWPGVESIYKKNTKTAFYLGPITRLEENHFYLKCYDAAGNWEKEYKLSYDEIFKIELDSAYYRHFNAYMRKRNNV